MTTIENNLQEFFEVSQQPDRELREAGLMAVRLTTPSESLRKRCDSELSREKPACNAEVIPIRY